MSSSLALALRVVSLAAILFAVVTPQAAQSARGAPATAEYRAVLATLPPVAAGREAEVRKLLRKNMGWGRTHGDLIFPSRIATPEGAAAVFEQLTDADMAVLIEIIRKRDTRHVAEHETAKWALQKFGAKALPIIVRIEQLYPRTEFVGDLSDVRLKIKESL